MNNDMASVISAWELSKRTPALLKGMPDRLKGLWAVARQKPTTPCGLGLVLEACAREHPDAHALAFKGERWTYQALNDQVNQFANALYRSGTRRGDVVAVLLENRPELLIAVAALAKLGAVAALLNTSQRGAVLQHSIDLVGAERAIVGAELIQAYSELAVSQSDFFSDSSVENRVESIFVSDPWSAKNEPDSAPEAWLDFHEMTAAAPPFEPPMANRATASEPFCYFYTSGTTGLPKAAILTHGRFMKAYAGVGLASIQLKTDDRVFICLPFYHATAMAVGWGSVLAGGACLVLERQFSASRFWDVVKAEGVTAFCYVGELCRYLLAAPESASDRNHTIRLMFGNGLRPNIWSAFKMRFGIERVMEFYGSSEGNVGFLNMFNFENTVGFTTVPYAIVEYDLENDQPIRRADGTMRRVRKGEAGLLLGEIKKSSPFDGYTDPEKTEQTILRDVFKKGDAWFNTGDLMRDQGYRHAQFVDRLGDTFRWKGENVSTAEVENVLAAQPSVLDGVAYGVEIPNTNGRAGMACLRLRDGERFDGKAFYDSLSKCLPSYAIPVFVRLAKELATTGTHKYQKNDLKKLGFELGDVSDSAASEEAVWVCLPKQACYQALTPQLLDDIRSGKVAF